MIPNIHPKWKELLDWNNFDSIYNFVKTNQHNLAPSPQNIFKAFNTDPENIKVCILGLSPYWSYYEKDGKKHITATGRAFAVPELEAVTPSLQVIIDAVAAHSYDIFLTEQRFDVTLQHWVNQGVFLLNKYLTSHIGISNAEIHKKIWDDFTDMVIQKMSALQPIVFNLWGKTAQAAEKLIDKKHHIVKACHPQATNYAAIKGYPVATHLDFVKYNVFDKTNELLDHSIKFS